MVTTRSMAKNLKRKRAEFERDNNEYEAKDQSLPPDDTFQPPQNRRKKRKLNNDYNNNNTNKVIATDNTDNKNPDNNKKSKKTKSKKKKSKKKAQTKRKTKKSEKNEVNDDELVHKLKEKHRNLLASGSKCVVGVDEAGRGPLAGPVVVSAAYVPIYVCIAGINDSKKINDEKEREKLYELIINNSEIKYSISILGPDVIDEYNILEASMMGMRQCVTKLHDQLLDDDNNSESDGVDYVLVDGNRDPLFKYPVELKYEYIIKGDSKIYCIGAASIIAKVTRDRIMNNYNKIYPKYNFIQNKGYPTPQHKRIVISQGPCEIHRKTFRPVKDWYKINKPDIYEKVMNLKKQRAEERKNKNKNKNKKDNKKKKKRKESILNFFKKNKKKNSNKIDKDEEQKDVEC